MQSKDNWDSNLDYELDSNKIGSVRTSLFSEKASIPISLFDKILFIEYSMGLTPFFHLEFLNTNIPFICCLLLVNI